ncbi:MAG: undecaprenyl-diphosphate phosphatase [Magnetospirillum sp.]|nr:undecaprenyl-diphosphate phosphatase [Magnetospirillum sp.]
MTVIQALFMAVLQGVTELFPVSSLAHAVILPAVLGWTIDQASPAFLPFVVALHIGTAFAALAFFWRDWLSMALAVLGQGTPEAVRRERSMLGHVVVATIPAVILALLFEKAIKHAFATPILAATFLVVNGLVLFLGERRRRQGGHRKLSDLTVADSLIIGLAQSTALMPGISRSGATMVAGLLRGLHHEDAARFSFLIATPIILGAGIHELPKLAHQGLSGTAGLAVIAGMTAGATAFAAIWILMRYFRGHDVKALDPFAWYCWAAGALSLAVLVF